jgi:4-amino-4-deoxy-L-arabinose transferase-like glycosyltransferase
LRSAREPYKTRLTSAGLSSSRWADLAVVPLIVVLSVPPLVWFAHDWTVGNDAARSLFAASELVHGQGLQTSDDLPFNGGHGPVFPALLGALILILGRDVETLAWVLRLLALLNPLLAYFLVKRISGPFAGLISAALVTLFGNMSLAINIDAVLLMLYLLALLTLLTAIDRDNSVLALLSGVLLGASILTKETAFASLPLALLAALLLDWELRKALWHYLGLGLVCLLWWIWSWSASGQVYLFDRLPTSLQLPVLVAAATLLAVGTLAYATGTVARFLAGERRRRWTGWSVALVWTVSLSGVALATGAPALMEASRESLRLYLARILAPSTVIVPGLVLLCGYVLWKTFRRVGPWRILALALVFQLPVCLLVVLEGWAPRQFLVVQTLLFCALAGLVVDTCEAALRGRNYSGRLVGALVAVPLVILLLAFSVERVQALLPDKLDTAFERRRAPPQAGAMAGWMAANVPEGERILVTPAYSLNRYLVFLDGGRHEWTFLRLDQEPCEPKPNVQTRCDPDDNALSRTPPDAVWAQIGRECTVTSLSMSNLLEQVRRTGSAHVMISGGYTLPGIMELPSRLQEGGAFEVVHSELDHRASGANDSLVLLESTGRAPTAVPTQMTATSLLNLKRCEQAEGPGYEQRIGSTFPNGISTGSDQS